MDNTLHTSTHTDLRPVSWRYTDTSCAETDASFHTSRSNFIKGDNNTTSVEGSSSLMAKPLRSKASSSSIASSASTAQSFVSTFSFSTITGGHNRMNSQEEMLEQLNGAAEWDGETESTEGNVLLGGEVDIESLDISIATPLSNISMEPFSTREKQAHPNHHVSSQPEQLNYFRRSRGHAKTFSQQSCSTIRGGYTEDVSSSTNPADLLSPESSTLSRQQPQQPQQPQALSEEVPDDIAEDMLFASPYYRKSVALSDHSDLALDPSSPSGRGSSVYVSEMGPQYTNLLRDATMIIEQQHIQDTIQPGSTGDDSDSYDIDQVNHHNLVMENNGRLQHHSTRYSNSQISEAGSDTGKNALSSTKSTLTRSRSRRFSAPGHPGTSHNSLASHSTGTGPPLSRTESTTTQDTVAYIAPTTSVSRAPQSFSVDDEPIFIDYRNSFLESRSSRSSFADGGEENGLPKYGIHPLQHHATMQPYSNSEYESDTPNLAVMTSSSNSQHQPRLHHDYRPGVAFEYYEGEWDWLPNFDEMRPDNAGIVGNFMIDDTTEQDLFRPRFSHPSRNHSGKRQFKETGNFAIRFTTYIDITQDGVYSFWLSSNDGSVLYVSNTLVVENDGVHYTTEAEGRIMLQAGKHPMSVEFFHKNGKMLEGFRSTGPSLIVSYRAPGPIWSFGLKSGPKKIIKSNNLFYDHGDIRLRNLLREFGVDDDSSVENNDLVSPNRIITDGPGVDYWPPSTRNPQNTRLSRHKTMSGDLSHLQPSARELNVQMENAKTTIRDLEQIIRDQAESHKRKMTELYAMLEESQGQVDRLVSGMKRSNLFETPRTTVTPTFNHVNQQPSGWRNTVMSIYVDAEEDYPLEGHQESHDSDKNETENAADSDNILAKHLADVEKLKQLYFFSMALSVKMNCEMMGKKPPEYTTTSVQRLYEECAIISKVPVEGWPGYVSRYFGRRPTV